MATVARDSILGQPRAGARGRPVSAPALVSRGERGRRCVTPRQTCPRPGGLGRNLRSKTRWFTGFCNSHQVSHFATFFIDARAEISIAESRYRLISKEGGVPPHAHRVRGGGGARSCRCIFLGAIRAGVRCCASGGRVPRTGLDPETTRGEGRASRGSPAAPPVFRHGFAGRSAGQISTMILPQVHLRKPCYDFSFL